MDAAALYRQVLESGVLPNVSAYRLKNIVLRCFAPRYLVADGQPALYLKKLLAVLASTEMNQLFFLYTCRANPILADFIR
jgi:hypothetical protein